VRVLTLSLVAVAVCAVSAGAQQQAVPPVQPIKAIKIVLVGDSTVQAGSGWGGAFCAHHLTSFAACVNLGRGGRSSSSYIAEGSWDLALAEMSTPGFLATYVLIQFGHNDQPGKPMPADSATEFPANMRQYVQEVRETGARAVLITSLTRRTFKDGKLNDTLEPWASATKKAAAEEKVPVLDLNADSAAAVQKMGPTEANKFAMTAPPQAVIDAALQGNTITVPANPPTTFDYTHLGERGSVFFGRMVADEVARTIPDLRPYIKP